MSGDNCQCKRGEEEGDSNSSVAQIPRFPEQNPDWANIATVPVLAVFADFEKIGFPPRGSDIAFQVERRFEDPPSDSTVYRALELLEENGYIEQIEASRYLLTETGRELLE